ncbi:MAG: T9SS type A sorting domain-containing protein [Bacteroidales bacterium]|nr:T9SS type A sorting domain-containing protein [Bacteroidales bacterium]
MRKLILTLILFCIISHAAQAQITRGAEPGEIYVSNGWYGDNQQGLVYFIILRSTNHGESFSIQHENTDPPPPGEMKIVKVLGDAAPGVLYNWGDYELWGSYDYGTSWNYRENSPGQYLSGQIAGKIYRINGAELSESDDFGNTFSVKTDPINCPIRELGYYEGEFYGINGNIGEGLYLDHTFDYGETFTEIPIDSSVAFWQISGKYPEISRGTQPGELYLVSWWPQAHYKIFHSTDSGYTWTQQYKSEYINLYIWGVQYTAGREPGSFYVKRIRFDSTVTHSMIYIDYSSDYGKTFTTYFHELDSTYVSAPESVIQNTPVSAYPNPFSHKTTISFQLPRNCDDPLLNIYNIQGKLIRRFNIKDKTSQTWKGCDNEGKPLPNGIYLYNVQYDQIHTPTNKLLLTN